MTVGEAIDRLGAFLSERWGEFTQVFFEPISAWPLWAGIVVVLCLFLFWSMAIGLARAELINPSPEQRQAKLTFWDSPWFMFVGSLICAAVSVWIFVSGQPTDFLGLCFAFMAWFFFRGIGVQKAWVQKKRRQEKWDD